MPQAILASDLYNGISGTDPGVGGCLPEGKSLCYQVTEQYVNWKAGPTSWLYLYFQEPEVRKFSREQLPSRDSYTPVEMLERPASVRASSMPRLAENPQVNTATQHNHSILNRNCFCTN